MTTKATSTTPAFLPLNDRLLVRRLEAETTTSSFGSLIMPDSLKEKPLTCEVVAVSLGRLLDSGRLIPSILRPGDLILVGKYTGTEVKLEGQEYLTLREDEAQGIVGEVDKDRMQVWLAQIGVGPVPFFSYDLTGWKAE
jgi:chaperonin GroES